MLTKRIWLSEVKGVREAQLLKVTYFVSEDGIAA